MSVSGVGGNGSAAGISGSKNTNSDDVIQDFLNYMKESPAQRMEEAWLNAHGITKQQFDAMSPAEKQKIIAQMKQDIEDKLKRQAENAATDKSGKIFAS